MTCKADSYTVNHDQWNTIKHEGGCAKLGIDFDSKNNRIFKGLTGR
jgi:hypothetical protein